MLRNTGGHYKLEERPETDSPSNLSQRTNPTNTSTSNFWLPSLKPSSFVVPLILQPQELETRHDLEKHRPSYSLRSALSTISQQPCGLWLTFAVLPKRTFVEPHGSCHSTQHPSVALYQSTNRLGPLYGPESLAQLICHTDMQLHHLHFSSGPCNHGLCIQCRHAWLSQGPSLLTLLLLCKM